MARPSRSPSRRSPIPASVWPAARAGSRGCLRRARSPSSKRRADVSVRRTVKLMRAPGEPVESATDVGGFIVHCAGSREWRVLHAIDDVGDTEVFGPWVGDLLADWDEARALVRSFADESC